MASGGIEKIKMQLTNVLQPQYSHNTYLDYSNQTNFGNNMSTEKGAPANTREISAAKPPLR